VFQVATILILPLFFGLTGIWFAMVAADLLAAIVTMVFLIKLRGRYGY
jgi:Na+-driven multidrug efflux pump